VSLGRVDIASLPGFDETLPPIEPMALFLPIPMSTSACSTSDQQRTCLPFGADPVLHRFALLKVQRIQVAGPWWSTRLRSSEQ
jgi:hypothetical protein